MLDPMALDEARELWAELQPRLAKVEKRYRVLVDVIGSLEEPPSPDELAAELGIGLELALALLAGDPLGAALTAAESRSIKKDKKKDRG